MIKNIIFDWSGTLSNDLDKVYSASMKVFEKLNRKTISLEEYKTKMRSPYMEFWNEYFPKLTIEEENKLYTEALYEVEEPKIYPGVKTELKRLKELNKKIIIISSHPEDKLIKEAKKYEIENMFQEINGSIHDKEEIIIEIIERNKFNPQETIYVGDMDHDIEAGKKAKVITAAIGWGYHTKTKLMKSNPDYYISNISELKEIIN